MKRVDRSWSRLVHTGRGETGAGADWFTQAEGRQVLEQTGSLRQRGDRSWSRLVHSGRGETSFHREAPTALSWVIKYFYEIISLVNLCEKS